MSVTSIEARRNNMKVETEASFTRWMDKPETKLMLSLIPPSENPDALQTLLRSCFAEGHGAGEGAVAIMMIEAMLKPKTREDDRRFGGNY